MAFKADTDEVRRVIRELKKIAGSVQELSTQDVRQMQNAVEESLEGDAAKALTEVLGELSGDIKTIRSGLTTVQRTLEEYVRRLEKADRDIEQAIRG